jgi:osmoprotectant transport system ATP-binding protein
MATPAIEFRDVSLTRAGGARVLDHFNLTVDAGEVLALVGRSGAGKTTILKLVNRLLLPDAGAVLVEGRDTQQWEPIRLRRRIGYVLQDVGLFPHMTLADNVAVVPRLEGWPPDRIQRRVVELFELIGLPQFQARWPDELSGGQRQRVGVARALAVDPPMLLMDEPFGALDPITRAELHEEFRAIQRRLKKTIIIVTHDMGEAFALGDRLGVLDEGRLIACDHPAAIAASSDARVRRLLDAIPRIPERELGGKKSDATSEAESLRSNARSGSEPGSETSDATAEREFGSEKSDATPEAESLRSSARSETESGSEISDATAEAESLRSRPRSESELGGGAPSERSNK